jgi:hypothetical protein
MKRNVCQAVVRKKKGGGEGHRNHRYAEFFLIFFSSAPPAVTKTALPFLTFANDFAKIDYVEFRPERSEHECRNEKAA